MAHYEDCKFFIRSTCVKGELGSCFLNGAELASWCSSPIFLKFNEAVCANRVIYDPNLHRLHLAKCSIFGLYWSWVELNGEKVYDN